jgi:hypothetical protein
MPDARPMRSARRVTHPHTNTQTHTFAYYLFRYPGADVAFDFFSVIL